MNDFILDFNRSVFDYDILKEMRQFASRDNDNDPIIRENTAAILTTLISLKKPSKILEAGTSIGYSSLVFAFQLKKLGVDFKIDTVEIDESKAEIAKNNFKRAGFSNIRPVVGDSVEVFRCLEGKYDMIFLDSSKSHYVEMLPECKRLLNKGGLLVADDIVFYGKSYDKPEDAPHKHRTIVSNLRDFVENIKNDDEFTAFVDPIDDGILIAVYNGE